MILPTFGDRTIKSITPSDIEVWLANLDRAPNTRGKALQILRAILDLARRDRLISVNPAADVKSPPMKPLRPGRALTDEQMIEVINAAEEVDERTAVLVHLAARCGLRIGEALALRTKDVDLDAKTITVATSLSRKEGIRPLKGRHNEHEARVINIPDDVVDRLRRHLDMRPVASIGGHVVTAPRGGPLPYDRWRSRTWVKIVERLDFHATAHYLRKTTVTQLLTTD